MRYAVNLAAHGNPDHYENPFEMVAENMQAEAESIEECQKIVRSYIEENCLGGGNWTGGQVFENGEQIGYISYNGRYWPKGSEYYR